MFHIFRELKKSRPVKMSNSWKKDREQLIAWADEKEKTNEEENDYGISKGNLAVVSGLSFAFVVGLYYFTSSQQRTIESQLDAVDEEIDVEEEYELYSDNEDY